LQIYIFIFIYNGYIAHIGGGGMNPVSSLSVAVSLPENPLVDCQENEIRTRSLHSSRDSYYSPSSSPLVVQRHHSIKSGLNDRVDAVFFGFICLKNTTRLREQPTPSLLTQLREKYYPMLYYPAISSELLEKVDWIFFQEVPELVKKSLVLLHGFPPNYFKGKEGGYEVSFFEKGSDEEGQKNYQITLKLVTQDDFEGELASRLKKASAPLYMIRAASSPRLERRDVAPTKRGQSLQITPKHLRVNLTIPISNPMVVLTKDQIEVLQVKYPDFGYTQGDHVIRVVATFEGDLPVPEEIENADCFKLGIPKALIEKSTEYQERFVTLLGQKVEIKVAMNSMQPNEAVCSSSSQM
jgi:hypothetical protein